MNIAETSDVQYFHGVFIQYVNQGVLITGNPGAGKSTLALKLVSNGGCLIADDLVKMMKVNHTIYGQLPNHQYAGLLHLRQSGFVSVDQLHENAATKKACKLTVIISLSTEWQALKILSPSHQFILGINIPFYSIHTSNTDAIYSIIDSVAKMN